jgi:DNA-binding response OmpR family regulator
VLWPKTVLVLGRDPDILWFVRDILAKSGYQVIVANSLRGMLAGALNHRPDAIFALNLFGYTDLLSTLLFRLSTTPNARRAPLIVSSAWNPNESDAEKWVPGFRPGYDLTLNKPFAPLEMIARVREAIAKAPTNH